MQSLHSLDDEVRQHPRHFWALSRRPMLHRVASAGIVGAAAEVPDLDVEDAGVRPLMAIRGFGFVEGVHKKMSLRWPTA